MAAAVDENALASAFLRELGAPDTPEMRKAVIAWLRQESGSTIIGNNPFNITSAAARNLNVPICGERTSRAGLKFAIFCNPTDGAKAAARLLQSAGPNDWRKYFRVVAAAKSANPEGFLDALARSAWSGDRYGGPENNNLMRVYRSITGSRTIGTSDPVTQTLWGVPEGKVLTKDDIDTIIREMDKAGLFDPHVPIVGVQISENAKAVVRGILEQEYLGKPWNEATRKAIQERLFGAATQVGQASDPLGIRPLLDVVGKFSDPAFWAKTLALLAGAILVGFGTWRLLTTA